MSDLEEFCLAHEGLFLVPGEELSAQGLNAGLARRLGERGLVSGAWLERFDQAFRLYWRRAQELARRSPRDWLPPRAPNVCVALDPQAVRPFFQPLGSSSCLVDHGDFEPSTSSLEFATYQFFHVERVNLVRQVVPALVHDLGYWLLRTREELEDFKAGCRRARGGEARDWRALARALDWIPSCHHVRLKPPSALAGRSSSAVPGTGFLVPGRFRGELERLTKSWGEAAGSRVQAYFALHASRTGKEAEELADWMRAEQPLLLVTGRQGEILWDPERPEESERLRAELAGVTSAAALSLRADWQVVGVRSHAFLDSLARPAELPAPGATIDQNGLAYLKRGRKLIAYNLREPQMQRLREPTPPFERWMLGARTVHEWGHLAVEAGYVPVPEARRPEFEAAQARLAELFAALVADAPAPLRAHAAGPLAALERRGTPGRTLVELLLGRMSDWQSNLLAQRYLPRAERETYVRNNVRPLLQELDSTQLFQALARYAFEYQYLAFSSVSDPRRYFLGCTWFGEQFLERGVLSEARLEALLMDVRDLCHCHEVDESRFRGPAPAGSPPLRSGAETPSRERS